MQSYVAENFWSRAVPGGASALDRPLVEELVDEAFGLGSPISGVAVEVFATPCAEGFTELAVHNARKVGHHHIGQALTEGQVQFLDAVRELDGRPNLPPYRSASASFPALDQLSARGLAYVHLMDQLSRGSTPIPTDFLKKFRNHYQGTLILAGGMTRERAESLIQEGLIDIAAFGEPFIANPDLVERLRNGWSLTKPDRALSFAGGGRKGLSRLLGLPSLKPIEIHVLGFNFYNLTGAWRQSSSSEALR